MRAKRGAKEYPSLLGPGVDWGSLRVLAVDDMPDMQEYFKDIADRLGFACDIADSGKRALEMVERRGPYDLYFIDWKMPGMDGMELTRRIKEHSGRTAIAVMVSAMEWHVLEAEAKEAGVDKFLSKPLFPSTIADCINECLGVNALPAKEDAGATTERFEGHSILLVEDV